jgi:hypothetical protein
MQVGIGPLLHDCALPLSSFIEGAMIARGHTIFVKG